MAHEYSVIIHEWLSDKVKEAKQGLKSSQAKEDNLKNNFHMGQLKELDNIRKYLTEKIDLDTHQYYQK